MGEGDITKRNHRGYPRKINNKKQCRALEEIKDNRSNWRHPSSYTLCDICAMGCVCVSYGTAGGNELQTHLPVK